jgi:hypothetical protein
MVTEAVETFARQLARRPELLQPAGQHYVQKQPAQPVTAVVRQPGLVRAPSASVQGQTNGVGQGQQQNKVQRAEEVLMAVAGCATKDLVTDMESLTEDEFVAATKKKGLVVFDLRLCGVIVVKGRSMLQRIANCLGLRDLVFLCMVWAIWTWLFGNFLYLL